MMYGCECPLCVLFSCAMGLILSDLFATLQLTNLHSHILKPKFSIPENEKNSSLFAIFKHRCNKQIYYLNYAIATMICCLGNILHIL